MAEWINDPQGREEIEKVTKELKLPVWKANYKGKFRDFWNELWDKIEDYVLKLKGDTEKNSKGLNDRLVSAVGKHDGDFPISNAVVGNVYYSELTKKYYKCKIGGPAPMPNGNFIDLSILENLNRLENLITIESYRDWNIGNGLISSTARVYKIGLIKLIYISFTTDKILTQFNFRFPITFQEPPYVSYTDNGSSSTVGQPFGIDWATTTGVLLSEIQSATMLVVGI